MARKALKLDEVLGRLEYLAEDYALFSAIYDAKGDLDRAETMLRKKLSIVKDLGDDKKLARTYANLGLLNEKRGAFDEAETLYRKSLELFRAMDAMQAAEEIKKILVELRERRT